MIKHFIERLFCEHDYELDYWVFIDTGMGKMLVYHCTKCDKSKCKFI